MIDRGEGRNLGGRGDEEGRRWSEPREAADELTMRGWSMWQLVITFGILHRFFGHKSYSCDR
jgi:hypothetical protein